MSSNRIHPRVPAGFEAVVIDKTGKALRVKTSNISISGIMLSVNHDQFREILQDQISTVKGAEPVEFGISLSIPSKNNKDHPIKTNCRAVYVRRFSQNHYQVGLNFLKLDITDEEAIKKYVLANIGSAPKFI